MVFGIIIRNTGSGASINSGNPIWFNGVTSLNFPWKRSIQTPVNNSGVIAKVNQAKTVENPVYVLNGFIDCSNTSGAYTINSVANCSKVTPLFLNQLLRLTHSPSTQLSMGAYWGDYPVLNVTGGSNGCNIVVEGVVWSLSSDSVNSTGGFNPIWNYNVTLREVTAL